MTWSAALKGQIPKLDENEVYKVPCTHCGAPTGQWCSQSYARRSGGEISAGDWRTPHASRQRAAIQKVVAEHRRSRA